MAKLAKLLQAAAGAGGAAALNVEDVFSTYVYTGTSAQNTISNGIDLSTEGGLVWTKCRSNSTQHALCSTETGVNKDLSTANASALNTETTAINQFNTDGYRIAGNATNYNNSSLGDYASWTFRKAPKFFDVVTYTGTGSATTISHNLGSVPGCIIVKCTSNERDWYVYHRGSNGGTNPEQYKLNLNSTAAAATETDAWNNTAPTSSVFTVGSVSNVNASGFTYVAYLFAHNNGDGEFGPTGDQDIIKCGTWTGTGSVMDINLGFEPQWIIYKRTDATGDWEVFDNMRGLVVGGSSNSTGQRLIPNRTEAEGTTSPLPVVPTPTGFRNESSFHYTSGRKFIYIAIRRGPMAAPESATDVFGMSYAEDAIDGTFPVDAVITTALSASDNFIRDRLRGTGHLKTNTNGTEGSGGSIGFDHMTGLDSSGWGTGYIHWLWRRAPNFFDVVCYEGNAVEGHDISHNLGAVPEMIWVKNRETASQDWYVYHKDVGNTHYFRLNAAGNPVDSTDAWNDTTPTDSVFTVGGAGDVNWNGINHVAYLFTSLAGISKVGSYAGNGSSQTIDCGFSSGARFVLIKGYNSTVNYWHVFDSERGIVVGNDPYLRLDENQAQETSYDPIDPHSSGFIVNQVSGGSNINYSGRNYIFYAIA